MGVTAVNIIQKSGSRMADTKTFVLSAETPDRVGDVVIQRGIDLTNFKENPVALVQHDRTSLPIGVWKNIRIQGDATLADLHLATPGTSRTADLARGLIEQGILRAVSVGFRSLEHVQLAPRGIKFLKSELLEASLVSVPMHPRAVMVAKSLSMTDAEIKSFFTIDPVGDNSDDVDMVAKALEEQALRYAATHRKAIYSLINATKAQRRKGEL